MINMNWHHHLTQLLDRVYSVFCVLFCMCICVRVCVTVMHTDVFHKCSTVTTMFCSVLCVLDSEFYILDSRF